MSKRLNRGFTRTPSLALLRSVFNKIISIYVTIRNIIYTSAISGRSKNTMPNLVSGFTLIEMLVSVTIAGLIMAVILFNYSFFTDSLSLNAAEQEMTISIRQAQAYGLTVREVIPGGGQFGSAYGVHFDPNNDPEAYYIFADINGDKKYTVGSGCGSGNTECIKKFILRNNIQITGICDQSSCPPEASVRTMDVTFLRPNPDASIYFMNNGGQIKAGPSLTGKVILTSSKGKTATIIIESTGQILAN
ncbi:MAG TPA: type II secretion system protein [Candidatus Paceibacterota bacterium]